MNYKRQEMEQRLPPPSPLLCSHLWTKTNEAGIRLNQEDIVLLSRVFCDYIQNTREGKLTALKLLNATVEAADPRHAYYPFGQNVQQTPLPAKDLQRFGGWIYKDGFSLSMDQIEVERNGGLEACETTGILGPRDYCVKTVKDFGRNGEVLVTMSNYARMMSEKPAIRETANQRTCEECAVKTCAYYPKRSTEQLFLPGAVDGVTNHTRNHVQRNHT